MPVHLVWAKQFSLPVPVRATEQTKTKKTRTTRVRNSVDFVELDGDHLCKDILVRVVNYTATLHDVDGGVGDETLGGPARVVWVWEMVTVENGSNVGASVKSEKEVEIVGFGFGPNYLDHSQQWVSGLHFKQFSLEWFNWLWCIVDQIDA